MNRGLFGPLVFLVCCLVATTARADATIEPLRFRDDVKNGFVTAPGIASEMRIQIDGTIARTTVTQYFLNDTEAWREGIYQFPLPDDAAVDSLTMMVGERRVIGFRHRQRGSETDLRGGQGRGPGGRAGRSEPAQPLQDVGRQHSPQKLDRD